MDRISCEELNYRIATTASGLDSGFLFLRNIPTPTTQVFKDFSGIFSQSEGGAVQHGCSNVTLTWAELTPKQAYWLRDCVDEALDGSRELYLTIKANDAQKVDYDWIDYVGTPHPVDFGEGGTMPGSRGRVYQNCTLFVNCLSVAADPTTGDPIVNPPETCTETFGGVYPALDGWCWQEIEGLSNVTNVSPGDPPCGGDCGQTYTIIGKDFQIDGINHPGNEFFGFNVDVGARPPTAFGIATTTEILGGTIPKGRVGNDSLTSGSTLVTGGGTRIPGNGETSFIYVSDFVNPITLPFTVPPPPYTDGFDDAQIGMEDVPTDGTVFFGIQQTGGLLGLPYSVKYTNIAWLIKE